MHERTKALLDQIITIDDEIIYLLSRRFELEKQIAKVSSDDEKLYNDQWKAIESNIKDEAVDKGLDINMIKQIRSNIKKGNTKI